MKGQNVFPRAMKTAFLLRFGTFLLVQQRRLGSFGFVLLRQHSAEFPWNLLNENENSPPSPIDSSNFDRRFAFVVIDQRRTGDEKNRRENNSIVRNVRIDAAEPEEVKGQKNIL